MNKMAEYFKEAVKITALRPDRVGMFLRGKAEAIAGEAHPNTEATYRANMLMERRSPEHIRLGMTRPSERDLEALSYFRGKNKGLPIRAENLKREAAEKVEQQKQFGRDILAKLRA